MPDLFEPYASILRQWAQECIAGTRTAAAGPELGQALLTLLDIVEGHRPRLIALESRLDDVQDLYERLIGQQRETIEALSADNDALRAKLSLYERKAPPPPEEGR
jgi:hypothetical protein